MHVLVQPVVACLQPEDDSAPFGSVDGSPLSALEFSCKLLMIVFISRNETVLSSGSPAAPRFESLSAVSLRGMPHCFQTAAAG